MQVMAIFWPKLWQCTKCTMYIWKHVICLYHQMEVYVQQCTCFSCTNIDSDSVTNITTGLCKIRQITVMFNKELTKSHNWEGKQSWFILGESWKSAILTGFLPFSSLSKQRLQQYPQLSLPTSFPIYRSLITLSFKAKLLKVSLNKS